MKTIKRAMAVLSAAFCVLAQAGTFYVATNGDDGADGSSEAPFATIAAGVSAAAASSAPRKVVVRTGTYKISSPIDMTTDLTIESETGNREDVVVDGQGVTSLVRWDVQHSGARLSGITFKNGYQTGGSGGGIYIMGGMITNCVVRDCLLNGNGAGHVLGGGIYISKSASVVDSHVVNNIVSNEYASTAVSSQGGGIYIDAGGGTLRNCVIENCMTYVSGSAKTAEVNSMGGGVFVDGNSGVSRITGCTVSGCVATNYSSNAQPGTAGIGGGIAVYRRYGAVISNCLVRSNMASYRGGGVAVGGASVVTHCTIASNSVVALSAAQAMGGGGVRLGGTSTLVNSLIEGNSVSGGATVTKQGGGGAVLVEGTGGLIAECAMVGNAANRGGACLLLGPTGGEVVSNCLVSANSAIYNGGAFAHNSPNGSYVVDCVVSSNFISDNGGCEGSVCKGEDAAANAGLTFRNCFISGNYGGGYVFAGALANSKAQPFAVEYSTIVQNRSGALFATGSSNGSYVSNYFCRANVFFGNTLANGTMAAIADRRGSFVGTTNAWYNFTGGGANIDYDTAAYGNHDTLTASSFADAENGDYRLVRASGAIDKGGPSQGWMEGRRRTDMGDGTMTVVPDAGGGYGVSIVRNNASPRLRGTPDPGCFELWYGLGMIMIFR